MGIFWRKGAKFSTAWDFFGISTAWRKGSFTRPDCRLYFSVNILTVDIPKAKLSSISSRVQTYINGGLHQDM